MKRVLNTLCFALLAVLILGFVSSFGIVKGEPRIVCVTPTPGGTIPGGTIPGSIRKEVDFLAIKNITQTTVFTVKNLENQLAYNTQVYLSTPDCKALGNARLDTLDAFATKRYALDELSNFPDTFVGEVHIKSTHKIIGTSQIISKITPTATFTPIPTATPTPSQLFMPVVIR